ncbi:hypothetical protein AB0C29_16405 [Actinoplanes sp. NPDC048791]|uniref:hypothetical protein n=1 Tax=Actinoplanes sp. NPDC048791 TaxID=3154623 RepID=UPI0033E73465
MSHDLYFWPSGATKNPRRLADRLADEKAGRLLPDSRVLDFRAELLRRWPDLADMIAPWHTDLGGRRPWGRTDLADRFAVLTLRYGWEGISALPVLAGGYGLDCYDPQSDRLMPAGSLTQNAVPGDDVGQVEGWAAEDHVVQLLRHISGYIGYAYDDLDEAALTGALDDKYGEAVDDWFEYPLSGTPALAIRLAKPPGSAVVSVRVEGAMEVVLAARIETLLDLL